MHWDLCCPYISVSAAFKSQLGRSGMSILFTVSYEWSPAQVMAVLSLTAQRGIQVSAPWTPAPQWLCSASEGGVSMQAVNLGAQN